MTTTSDIEPAEWTGSLPAGGSAGTALIEKALRLIDLVADAQGSVSPNDLIRRTRWPRATVYRILNALRERGYLRLDPISRTYSLGYHFLEIAQRFWTSADLTAVASAELQRLRNMTGETAYLAVLHAGAVLSLGKFESPHAVRSAAGLGVRKPLHCTSQGKAILAHLPDEQIEAALGQGPLARYTPQTIVDRDLLKRQLQMVRSRGYAVEDQEILAGNRCVGAAILDPTGKPLAAISVAGPIYRLTAERVERLGPEVAAAARLISAQLRPMIPPSLAQPRIELVAGQRTPAFHGASPLWDSQNRRLIWIDRLGPCVYASDRPTPLIRPPDGEPLEGALLGADGRLALFTGRRVFIYRDGALLADEELQAGGVYTASCVDSDGVPWIATLRDDVAEVGVLERDGSFRGRWRLPSRISAMAWAPDNAKLFVADAERGAIHVMVRGEERGRLLARIPPVSGRPEALLVDGAGSLWAAMSDGWGVAAMNPEGELESVIPIPAPGVTGLAYGGDDGRTLFVTTARFGLSREVLENAPASGFLLSMRLDRPAVPRPCAAYLPSTTLADLQDRAIADGEKQCS